MNVYILRFPVMGKHSASYILCKQMLLTFERATEKVVNTLFVCLVFVDVSHVNINRYVDVLHRLNVCTELLSSSGK